MRTRLRQFIESQNLTNAKFEKLCGFSNGVVGKFFVSGSTFSVSSLQKIHEAFPSLNIDWLVCGRGNMIYSELSSEAAKDKEFIRVLLQRVSDLENR